MVSVTRIIQLILTKENQYQNIRSKYLEDAFRGDLSTAEFVLWLHSFKKELTDTADVFLYCDNLQSINMPG